MGPKQEKKLLWRVNWMRFFLQSLVVDERKGLLSQHLLPRKKLTTNLKYQIIKELLFLYRVAVNFSYNHNLIAINNLANLLDRRLFQHHIWFYWMQHNLLCRIRIQFIFLTLEKEFRFQTNIVSYYLGWSRWQGRTCSYNAQRWSTNWYHRRAARTSRSTRYVFLNLFCHTMQNEAKKCIFLQEFKVKEVNVATSDHQVTFFSLFKFILLAIFQIRIRISIS